MHLPVVWSNKFGSLRSRQWCQNNKADQGAAHCQTRPYPPRTVLPCVRSGNFSDFSCTSGCWFVEYAVDLHAPTTEPFDSTLWMTLSLHAAIQLCRFPSAFALHYPARACQNKCYKLLSLPELQFWHMHIKQHFPPATFTILKWETRPVQTTEFNSKNNLQASWGHDLLLRGTSPCEGVRSCALKTPTRKILIRELYLSWLTSPPFLRPLIKSQKLSRAHKQMCAIVHADTHQVSRLIVAVCMCVHLFRWFWFLKICLFFSFFIISSLFWMLKCLWIAPLQLCLLACKASWSGSGCVSWFEKCR